MAFSTGCHGDMQMKSKTLSSFSGNLQYNRGTKCRWKDITTHAKMTWKQVQINVTENISAKRNGIMTWSVWSRTIQVDLMKKTYFKWMFDRGTNMDWETNSARMFYSESMARPLENKGLEERPSNLIGLLKDIKLLPK